MTVELPKSVIPDADDLQILRELRRQPRASFAAIGGSVGMSETAVARRVRRLDRQGTARVIGTVNMGALGRSQWMVRIRCRPDAVVQLTNALAHRDDVAWIAVTSAGFEITCAVASPSHETRNELLGVQLPRTKAVIDIRAALVLHRHPLLRPAYAELQSDASTRTERMATPTRDASLSVDAQHPPRLDAIDHGILSDLARDGRASLTDLATRTTSTPGVVSRHLALLEARGVLDLQLSVAAAALGYRVQALLWLRVRPSHAREVGRQLANAPGIQSVAATSGIHNLYAVVHCHDLDELYALTSDHIGTLDGVQDLEVAPLLTQVKQEGITMRDGLLTAPGS